MIKVLAINGSPRKDGNTSILLGYILKELENEGIETEVYQIGGKKVHGCTACMKCFENRDGKCSIDNDPVNALIEKMTGADGIILGSPVYFLDVTPEMKALIDRIGFVSFANDRPLRDKVGNVAVAVRRSGGVRTADTMLHFLFANAMIVPGFPAIGIGRDIGDVEGDEEGIANAKMVGQSMARVLKHLDRYPLPVQEPDNIVKLMTKKKIGD
jgi:multimeric flavodoxin WrbA